jgi:hypothetical protein
MLDRLFKNREVRIRVAKTDPDVQEDTELETTQVLDPEEISQIATDVVTKVAIGIGALMALGIVLHTISEVIINKSKQDDEDE